MIKPSRRSALAAVLALAAAPIATVSFAEPAHAAPPVRYTYVDLGTIGPPNYGDAFSRAHAINAGGQIVGYSTAPGSSSVHAFSWQNGVMTDLGLVYNDPFSQSSARSVNDNGDVVGHGNVNATEPSHALLFRNGRIQDLGTGLGSGSGSYANDINNSGVVVGGRIAAAGSPDRAVIWQNGTIRALGSLGGTAGKYGTESVARAVNNSGLVVGGALPPSGPLHGFIWNGRKMRDLGTLGGNNEATDAYDINDLGQVTGVSPDAAGRVHAFLWQNGVMRDLGVPPGANSSFGQAVNNHGQVVGNATFGSYPDPNSRFAAVVWQDGVAIELRTLVDNLPPDVALWNAFSINDSGVIVGATCVVECYGTYPIQEGHAFMLIPKR